MKRRPLPWAARGLTALALGLALAPPAGADTRFRGGKAAPSTTPGGGPLLRLLGPRAAEVFAPSSGSVAALVALPPGAEGASLGLGLEPVAPGIGRLRGSPEAITRFAADHPALDVEVAPPLHLLLDRVRAAVRVREAQAAFGGPGAASVTGAGALVGIADTGIDFSHSAFKNPDGTSRVLWMLDLSSPPLGKYPDLEKRYGVHDAKGALVSGAVYDAEAIASAIQKGTAPIDDVGHGTHVGSIAAGGPLGSDFAGIAPGAGLLVVKLTHGSAESIENDDLVRGVGFLFDRADHLERPIAVNMSLGSDFGSHDGKMLWERAIASHVGPSFPGHVIVAAAGNSGSVAVNAIHQSVYVDGRTDVPIAAVASSGSGGVQVWVTFRRGAKVSVGLEAPGGEWIAPVGDGAENGYNTPDVNAGVIVGSSAKDSPIPPGSTSAIAVWTGKYQGGLYSIRLEGRGGAELYVEGVGESTGARAPSFVAGTRSGTINLPATEPSIIGVGCTVSKASWVSIHGTKKAVPEPLLDFAGGLPRSPLAVTPVVEGDVCYFSSAGPSLTGAPKPEISAPGAAVVGAMSRDAPPESPRSIFTSDQCTSKKGPPDPNCLQIDADHAVALGTSMSAPVVAGAAAILLARDPALTQGDVATLLQAGAHDFRRAARFADQGGSGEVDVAGSLVALERMRSPALALPDGSRSWVTLGASYVAADGASPLHALLELRSADGAPADLFDRSRLVGSAHVRDESLSPGPVTRRGPGLYAFDVAVPEGRGGESLRVGATFDGRPIVTPKVIPIATDPWNASYAEGASGGCSAAGGLGAGSSQAPRLPPGFFFALALALPCTLGRRGRRRTPTGRGRRPKLRAARRGQSR